MASTLHETTLAHQALSIFHVPYAEMDEIIELSRDEQLAKAFSTFGRSVYELAILDGADERDFVVRAGRFIIDSSEQKPEEAEHAWIALGALGMSKLRKSGTNWFSRQNAYNVAVITNSCDLYFGGLDG